MNKTNSTQIARIGRIFADLFRYFRRGILSVFIRCICVISVLLPSSFAQSQNYKVDSLFTLLKTDQHDTTRITTLNAIAWELKNTNPDSTILLATQAAALAKKLALTFQKGSNVWKTIKKGEANAYGNAGVGYSVQGDYPNALGCFLRALKIDEELGSKNSIATALGNIGNVYKDQGDYPNALDYYLRALKIHEELGNKNGIATWLGNIGLVYWNQGDYPKALDYYLRALKIDEELGNKNGIARHLCNIGIIYDEQGDYPKALDYYLRALKIDEEIGNINGIAICFGNIGNVYYVQGDYPNALGYHLRTLKINEETGNKNGIAKCFGNIGLVYSDQGDYPKALDYYLKALKIDEEIGNKNGIAIHLGNIGNIYNAQGDYPNALNYYLRALKIDEELGDKNGIAIWLGNIGSLYTSTKKYTEAEKYLLDALKIDKEIGAMYEERYFEQKLSELYEKTGHCPLALEHYKKAMVLQDTLFNEEKDKELIRKEMNYQFEKKEAAAKAEHDKLFAVAAEKSKRQQVMLWFAAGILILVSIFSFWIFKERKKSENLLLNILPVETARELKKKGKALPKHYELVTVLFTDFKGFTKIAEKMSVEGLVAELDFIFRKFDEIISRYPIEKIKTIGDAYMCAGGLPVANTTNPLDVVMAALDIKQFIEEYKQQCIKEGKQFFEIRIGVHTGAIVAGVVGDKKFAYDIWGDTVNTASRMESSGEPGQVNISGSTYQFLQTFPKFKTLEMLKFTFRGKIPAKNKGEIEMYFVERSEIPNTTNS